MQLQQRDLDRLCAIATAALSDLGFKHRLNDVVYGVSFSHAFVSENEDWLILQVDVDHLPRNVSLHKLRADAVADELAQRLGYNVHILTKQPGCVFAIHLVERVALPIDVPLDLTNLPTDLPYAIPLGATVDGVMWESLANTGHILIGGTTQGGKSTWINSVLASLLTQHGPDTLSLRVIDPKIVEFAWCAGLPHLNHTDVAENTDEAISLIEQCNAEMENRAYKFKEVYAKTLASYNERVAPEDRLPRVVVIVDEATDLVIEGRDAFNTPLIQLLSKGAALGFSFILATQAPNFQVFPVTVKRNCITRIAFFVASLDHSRLILDTGGAELLSPDIPGRLLARVNGHLLTLQGTWVGDDKLLDLATRLRGSNIPTGERKAPMLISETHAEMVRWAIENADGRFPVRTIWQEFKSVVSYRALRALAENFQRRGWLETDTTDPKMARIITEELQRQVYE